MMLHQKREAEIKAVKRGFTAKIAELEAEAVSFEQKANTARAKLSVVATELAFYESENPSVGTRVLAWLTSG